MVSHTHNRIFEHFVGDDLFRQPDLKGMVAYSLYKVAKRQWAANVFERNARPPTAAELAEYAQTWTPAQIESHERQAEQILKAFASDAVVEATPEIERAAQKDRFWPSVWTSIFANMLYTLFLIALVIILRRAGVDLLSIR